jgi:hypothetical protein
MTKLKVKRKIIVTGSISIAIKNCRNKQILLTIATVKEDVGNGAEIKH